MVKRRSRIATAAPNPEILSGSVRSDEEVHLPPTVSAPQGVDAPTLGDNPVEPPGLLANPIPTPSDDAVLGMGEVQGVNNPQIAGGHCILQESCADGVGDAPNADSDPPPGNAPETAPQVEVGALAPPRRSVTCGQCGKRGHQVRTCKTAVADYLPGFPLPHLQQRQVARTGEAARVPIAERRQVALAFDREALHRVPRRSNVPDDADIAALGRLMRQEDDMADDDDPGDDDEESGASSDSSEDNADVAAGEWNFADCVWECVCDETSVNGQHAIPLSEPEQYNLRSPPAQPSVFGRDVPSHRGPPGSATASAVNIPHGCTTARQFVELIFTDEIVSKLVESTNAAAHPETGHPRVKELWRVKGKWSDVDVPKMRTWLCVAVYLGVVKVQYRKHIWSKNSIFRQPWVCAKMSAIEFDRILAAVNFCNHWSLSDQEFYRRNTEIGPFWQVQDLVELCNANSQAYFRCGHRISIDEGVIPFKGKHCARCFNPKKPFKYHLKKYMCNDSETGYCYRFYFYDGAGEHRPLNMPATAWPVIKLLSTCTCLHHKNHLVATDNWFTGPTTSCWLQTHGFQTVGTIKANRLHLEKTSGSVQRAGFPKAGIFKGNRRPRGSIIVHRTTLGGMPHFVTSWQDKKPVTFLSSYMPSKSTCIRKVKVRGRWESVAFPRPSVIKHYNNTMGGTDLHDQRVAYFRTTLKSVRWHVRVLTDIFSSMLMNSFTLFKLHHKKAPAYTALDFLEDYLQELNDSSASRMQHEDASPGMIPERPCTNHKRAWWFGEEGSRIRKSGRHYLCHGKELFGDATDQRRGCMYDPSRTGCGRTAYACKQCGVSLCMAHFEQFHEE